MYPMESLFGTDCGLTAAVLSLGLRAVSSDVESDVEFDVDSCDAPEPTALMRGGISIGVQLILDGDEDAGSTVLSGLTSSTVLSGLSVLSVSTDVVDSLTGVSFLNTDR